MRVEVGVRVKVGKLLFVYLNHYVTGWREGGGGGRRGRGRGSSLCTSWMISYVCTVDDVSNTIK